MFTKPALFAYFIRICALFYRIRFSALALKDFFRSFFCAAELEKPPTCFCTKLATAHAQGFLGSDTAERRSQSPDQCFCHSNPSAMSTSGQDGRQDGGPHANASTSDANSSALQPSQVALMQQLRPALTNLLMSKDFLSTFTSVMESGGPLPATSSRPDPTMPPRLVVCRPSCTIPDDQSMVAQHKASTSNCSGSLLNNDLGHSR